MCALGVTEAPLTETTGDVEPGPPDADWSSADRDVVADVTESAARIASQRGVDAIGTTDVLFAVMNVYGADFGRVLEAHGTDADEVTERLGREPS